jgi:hypothetical protein
MLTTLVTTIACGQLAVVSTLGTTGNVTHCTRGPCGPGNQRCTPGSEPKIVYTFHLADASCGINDPNGPFYDERHGMYHLMYQDHLALPQPSQGVALTGPTWGHWVSRYGSLRVGAEIVG